MQFYADFETKQKVNGLWFSKKQSETILISLF